MTRSELATFICGKVNQNETEDVAACKGFLTRRHELIWQDALWKDSLLEYRQTLDPDLADYTETATWMPGKGVLLLPPILQRVLAARTATRKLTVRRAEFFYRIDYDAFAKTGEPADFLVLPPCVWETEDMQPVFAAAADGSDTATVLADCLDSDGVGVTRASGALSAVPLFLAHTERVDAFTKPGTSGAVTITAYADDITFTDAGTAAANNVLFERNGYLNGFPLWGEDPDDAVTGYSIYHGTPGSATTWVIKAGGVVRYFSGDDVEVPHLVSTWFAAPLGVGTLPAPTFPAATTLVTVSAADTNAKRRQRIRLIEIPSAELTIRVLGKRVPPAFSADNDEPGIAGMENCLIAFGLADMLERDESYGEAQSKTQEAIALLDQLKQIETVQQAHNSQIMPAAGYGEDSFVSGRADSANPLGW